MKSGTREGPADLAIWFRVPRPIGGMSVHLSRLLPRLQERGISFQMYNIVGPSGFHPLVKEVSERRMRWVLRMFLGPTEKVHYVAGSRWITRLTAILLKCLRGRRILLLIGGEDPYHFMIDPVRWPRMAAPLSALAYTTGRATCGCCRLRRAPIG